MCPHGFTAPKRLKTTAVDPKLLYADLDESDPRTVKPKPTIAIESSPGRYVGYWVTDEPASEELNRRLAYSIKADTSGWDRTQVLRIVGTRNYKYSSSPKVKLLWDNGPEYTIEGLESLIPHVKVKGNEEVEEEAAEIYRAYEKRLPIWVRKDLMATNIQVGKRSEVLWKLHHELLEAGLSRDEAFQLLWVSPWNKFRDRRNGAEQLLKELDKALSQHFTGYKTDRTDNGKWNPLPVPISSVERENIDWIIPGFLAKKEITILEGDPGLGKSYFMQIVAGAICDGKRLPIFDRYRSPRGRVAYFDTENTASTVTKSRLEDNEVENLRNYFQGEEGFSIDDQDRWEAVIDRLEVLRPKVVVFDTINTYIGSTDTYRSSETQQAMGFFKDIAVRFNCSVVVLRHLTKGSKDKALYRGQGSIAFTGAARIVATVGRMPDDQDIRVVACTKNNISRAFRSFTYTIESLPDRGDQTNRSRLIWGDQVDLNADDIVAAASNKPQPKLKDTTEEWLRTLLEEEGKVEATVIYKMAEARAISRSTVSRVAEKLGITRRLEGFGRGKKSYWSLPTASGA